MGISDVSGISGASNISGIFGNKEIAFTHYSSSPSNSKTV